jgi:predicted nucleic acid-binding protein
MIPRLAARVEDDGDIHVPHVVDVEVLHALRGLVLGGKLGEDRAADALTDLADLRMNRYPHLPLMDRIWELRRNLSAYDAAFVALAEALAAPLVTCDAALAASPGHHARVEVFVPAS